jgi:ornithine cyclodeaminase
MHLRMLSEFLSGRIDSVRHFDIRDTGPAPESKLRIPKVEKCSSWEEAYLQADIFITCTTTPQRYIDKRPKAPSLHLNVSLRDYCASTRQYMDLIAVDDWDEVNRENTDIELMSNSGLLRRSDAVSLEQIVCDDSFRNLGADSVAMFNPMGLAIFDLVTCRYIYSEALKAGLAVELE